jgi:hypothetical protein
MPDAPVTANDLAYDTRVDTVEDFSVVFNTL